jgi:hypothetical protein
VCLWVVWFFVGGGGGAGGPAAPPRDFPLKRRAPRKRC